MTNKSIDEQDLQDAIRFSNFAQRVKMEYWKQSGTAIEGLVDDLLLIAWKELQKIKNP